MAVATLIGDLVRSRDAADRGRLQRRVAETLGALNAGLQPLQPLEPTVGDEFQGAFASGPDAVRASLVIRLALLDATGVDSRYGLGLGEISVFDADRRPVSQDGPGWWAARAAIDHVKELEQGSRSSGPRTWLVDGDADVAPGAVHAYLLTRDALVARMNARQNRLLLGLLEGARQVDLAEREGISQSAVSQSLQRSGAYAITMAHDRLEATWSASA